MKPYRQLFNGLRVAFSDPRVLGLLGFTFVMILTASLFYRTVEGWPMLDAVYFSVITISTVGYGDFSPQTTPGKIFTIFYVLIGLGIFVAAATSVADAILSQRDEGAPSND